MYVQNDEGGIGDTQLCCNKWVQTSYFEYDVARLSGLDRGLDQVPRDLIEKNLGRVLAVVKIFGD